MTIATLSDPNWVRQAQAGVWEHAEASLRGVFQSLDLANPEQARARLLREVPRLVDGFGEMGSGLAADWYDEARFQAMVDREFRAIMAESFPDEYVNQRLRYGAGHLFTDTPEAMLPWLLDAMQEYVLWPGRETLRRSAVADPSAIGWRRVTSRGACDFCVMLAGRGAVYKESTVNFQSHGSCNCGVEPVWKSR